MGIADYDATNFMYLVGVLGVSLRALYYYANTGKRWTCYVTSLRTMKRGYSNNTYKPKESKYILYLTCNHPNSNMIGWNADAETVENITQQASTFFGAYNGLTLLNGATAFVPPADTLTYFRQKGVCLTPEEKAARDQIMQIILAPSHLGKVLALVTGDHDLSNLMGARLDSIILPKESDRKLLDEMKIRFGNKFVSMLKGKRKQQLEQYDRSVMKEMNEMSHLAAVVADQTDNISQLTSLGNIEFEGDDNATYARLSSKYGSELLNMLKGKRKQHLEQYDGSALKAKNDAITKSKNIRLEKFEASRLESEQEHLNQLAEALQQGGYNLAKLRPNKSVFREMFEGDDCDIFDQLMKVYSENTRILTAKLIIATKGLLPCPSSEVRKKKWSVMLDQNESLRLNARVRKLDGKIVVLGVSESAFSHTGLKINDLISSINGNDYQGPAMLKQSVDKAQAGEPLTLSIY